MSINGSLEMEAEGKTIDFSTPFKRVDIMSTLEEKIGEKLPDPNNDGKSLGEANTVFINAFIR